MTDSPGLEVIRAARERLDDVIEEIRTVPGYEGFLAVPSFDDVVAVTDEAPLVYLAAAELGGLALIVRSTDVSDVALDGLSAATVRERAIAYLDAYARYRASPGRGYPQWSAALDEVTSWLWDEVMGPVLDHVEHNDGENARGLVIVAGGLFGLLPLHAAWTADTGRVTGRRYVLDTTSVSYVPNARVLRAARRLAGEVSATRLLAVADPWPVAADPLPMAKYEAMTAASAFRGAQTTLQGPEATFLSFEWEAAKADVLHLACHGFAELRKPLDSSLVLAGRPVTLGRLMELHLRVRLAVLSACETALPGTELPDEVIALSAGLLQAGVAGVVVSQWSVPDRATAMLMTEFYRCWRVDHMLPSAALRAAQCWLRDTTTAEKRDHFQAAVSGHADWLPLEAGQAFLDWLYFEPEGRSHADIHHWGGFTYVGA